MSFEDNAFDTRADFTKEGCSLEQVIPGSNEVKKATFARGMRSGLYCRARKERLLILQSRKALAPISTYSWEPVIAGVDGELGGAI
jgi:hypothetical protein